MRALRTDLRIRLLRRDMRCPCAALTLLAAVTVGQGGIVRVCRASDAAVVYADPTCDTLARRTDPAGDGPFDPDGVSVDLRHITIGRWSPAVPASDLFDGVFTEEGEFVRLDLTVDGLVNPPGDTDPSSFLPFAFGSRPLYGFVEIDMDDDNETGGELEAPQYRYLGNVARFGGRPPDEDEFEHRVALDGSAFDGDFLTEPFVERHGEEFHLALLGGQADFADVAVQVGDGDATFETGEVWDLSGPWFHRAHGYEPFSVAKGGSVAGAYVPQCVLRFAHDAAANVTRVTVVFPLSNVGAALVLGEPPQENNHDASDQASVLEALDDLVVSAALLDEFPSGKPEEAIIIEWKDKDPEDYLDPTEWRITVLLGGSYAAADPLGEFFVWSDVYPNVCRGDVNGEDEHDDDDREAIEEFIAAHDGEDGLVDGQVAIPGFAVDFSVFDINQDGRVDAIDVLLVSRPGDHDGDNDVDLLDFGGMQVCFAGSGAGYRAPQCALSDLDMDGDVDLVDVKRLMWAEPCPEDDDDDARP